MFSYELQLIIQQPIIQFTSPFFAAFSGNALIIMLHISYNIFFMVKLIQELRL